MFTDNPNLIKYDEKVMIYKNFIPKDIVDLINSKVNEKVDSGLDESESRIPWYRDKQTGLIPELFDVWTLISEFLLPTHVIHPMMKLQVMRVGDEMFVHEDSPGEDQEHLLTNDDVWTTCTLLEYGVIAYFGEFSGGEVFYPELGIEVSPQPGDLVIHGATPRWKHGVREVTAGTRYAFSNFSLPAAKNPGTFHNYKTEEFNKTIENGLYEWLMPLIANERDYRGLNPEDSLDEKEIAKLQSRER
jgi:hypothetical protein